MSALNPHHPAKSYHCGRLFAELESLQRLAIPGLGAGISKRYFAGAANAPARVFAHLLAEAQAHREKLSNRRPGAYYGFTERLEQIQDEIKNHYPRTMTVEDRALFALGYWHQRAHSRLARREAAEARERGVQVEDTTAGGEAEDAAA